MVHLTFGVLVVDSSSATGQTGQPLQIPAWPFLHMVARDGMLLRNQRGGGGGEKKKILAPLTITLLFALALRLKLVFADSNNDVLISRPTPRRKPRGDWHIDCREYSNCGLQMNTRTHVYLEIIMINLQYIYFYFQRMNSMSEYYIFYYCKNSKYLIYLLAILIL